MDFRALFRAPPDTPARYVAASPLFPFAAGHFPLAEGSFRNRTGDNVLGFRIDAGRYTMSGGAPETVTLIPVAGHADGFVFQQSEGTGATFYGALRLLRRETGFALFSPEGRPLDAVRAARRHHAVLGPLGCAFAAPADLLSALVPLAFGAPEHVWHVYHPL
ncbi:hypothetical protein P6144_12510 [Sphingomonas sp. HITSZ_GF]|uniref:hypothetical protein n=1 Tax=Sphingomonas sp. HITSZ_GF TaxID=3037247 RepID=UPI00240DE38B|nr:hypothetical protein [Sphingomonas sp. HITSZ_GF]MDG2534476.1 hypothetical protein [Sphingomonas sp. HITSZ_GF]